MTVTSSKPEPCKLSRGRPCASCLELEIFDREAQAILEGLSENRQRILEKINQRHDPFIQRLPLELASQVFTFCIPPQAPDSDPHYVSLLWNNSECRIKPFNIVLGAICRAWRQVAWSTPKLWSTLPIALNRSENKDYMDLVLEWLGRSAQIPLDIFVVYNHVAAEKPMTLAEDLWKPLIDIANGCSSRWRTFNINAPGFVFAHITGDGRGTCILESLHIFECHQYQRSSYRFSLKNAIPKPRHLASDAMALRSIDIDWSNLSTIDIGGLHVNEILALLRWVPRLTRCTLSCLQYGEDDHLSPPTPTHHHTLEILDIQILDESQTAEQFLNLLILPSLIYLLYDSGYNSLENVAAFLDRSACKLTTLYDLNGSFQDLLTLAPRLQELERLEYPGDIGDGIQLPIQGDEIGRNILPNLRELSIHSGWVSWHLLADLITLCPLKTLSIYIEDFGLDDIQCLVDEAFTCRFEDLIKNGYNLKVTCRGRGESEDHDLLAWSAQRRMSQPGAAD